MRLLVKVVVAGVVTYAAYRAVRAFAPEGVNRFMGDVRSGMAEREAQLREALGLEPAGEDPMGVEDARSVIDDPTGPAPR